MATDRVFRPNPRRPAPCHWAVLVLELLEDRTLLSFSAPTFYNTGEAPRGAAVGDFNGDGNLDLVTVNQASTGSISVFLGNGDGTFRPAVNTLVGTQPWDAVVGDFNGDGNLDLMVSSSGTNSLILLLGDGQGGFHQAGSFPVGSGPTGMAVDDFNGDGNLDVVVGNSSGTSVSVLLGNGDGTFRPAVNYHASGYPYAVASGDLNGDGYPDLAVVDALGHSVGRLLGNGDGTFQQGVGYDTGPAFSSDVALGDFNGDGIPDVATANRAPGNSVSILPGYGNGTFLSPLIYPAGPGSQSVAVADFNADGAADLVTANVDGDSVSVLLGNGDGSFQPAQIYPSGPYRGSLSQKAVVGDFNGDGYPDLAVTNSRANVVAILLNNPDATHFQVSTADATVAGAPLAVTVTALNPFDHSDPAYRGTVHLASTDRAATVPADYTFTAADQGQHTFTVTLRTAGSQDLTVTDRDHSTISGAATVAVTPAAASTLLVERFPSPVTAGSIHTVTVTAKDPYGNTATGYTGTIHFSSSDPQALLEDDYTFQPDDHGSRVFGASLRTGGTQTIRATDTADATITGTQSGIVVNPAAADHFDVSGPASTVDGSAFNLTATARDAFGNLATGYRGTVQFTSSDAQATLPADYPFSTADAGTHTFSLTLRAVGSQTVTVRDTTNAAVVGSTGVLVNPVLFRSAVNYPLLAPARSLATGDFNGDGIPDLVTTGRPLSLLLGNGDGTFQIPRTINTPYTSFEVAVGDFNGDGKLDLVTADWMSSNTVSIFLGNGDGTFQAPMSFAAGSTPTGLAVGDFNGDGKLDLAVTNEFGASVTVYLGNGDGTLRTSATYRVGDFPICVRAGDFNRDGKLDLVAVNAGAGGFGNDTVTILLGNGDGTFQTGATYIVGSHPFSAVVGDFNGDGILDIATANEVSNNVGVLLGMGDGTFRPVVEYPDAPDPIWIAAGDFDRDGKLDLVTANDAGNSLHVLLGNGDGTYQPFKSFDAGTRPVSVAVGDWNGDGFLDLAATSETTSNAWVLLNAAEGQALPDGSGMRGLPVAPGYSLEARPAPSEASTPAQPSAVHPVPEPGGAPGGVRLPCACRGSGVVLSALVENNGASLADFILLGSLFEGIPEQL